MRLSTICHINNNTLSASQREGTILYLDTSNLINGRIIELQKLECANAPSRAQRKVRHNTILYSSVRPNQKHYGIVKYPEPNLIVSTGFTTLDIKEDYLNSIDVEYLYLLITQPCITSYLQTIAENSVSAYPSISPTDIGNLDFEFPPIEKQKLIAQFIFNLDRKIALNRQINRNLETLAKQIYDYWFVQFDFPDEKGNPYKSSGGKMVWNEILKREIPEGWKVKSVNDVSSICRGVSYKPNDLQESGILILRGNNIENNHIVYDNNTAYLLPNLISDEQRIKKHDIIITMSSGSKEHIGKCAMFQCNSEHSFGVFLSKITPDNNCPYFLFLYLISQYFKQKIKSICNGTGINNLTNQTFDEVLFAFPEQTVLTEFEKVVQPIFDSIGLNETEITSLTRQRDEILPLLMNGQAQINSDLSAC